MPSVVVELRPDQLFRPLHYMGYSLPDPNANYNLFDRVVNIRSGISVPLGLKGTIIGKHIDETKEINSLYDIVFDEEFIGGTSLRCSPGKGYKLSAANLINITYGLKLSGKYEQMVSSIGQPLQSKAQQSSYSFRQNANNHSFPSRDQNYGKFQFGYTFGQRMPRPRHQTPPFIKTNLPNPPFVNTNLSNPPFINTNLPNPQTAVSIQTLNHSKNSPFQSPKHGLDSTQTQNINDFPPMEKIWNALTNIKTYDNPCVPNLPKQSFADITAAKHSTLTPNESTLPKQLTTEITTAQQKQSTDKTKYDFKPQRNSQENRKQESVSYDSNKSYKNIPLIESFRKILSTVCEKYYKQNPKFEIITIGPMKSKSIKLILPDNYTTTTLINSHSNMDEAYECVSKEALEHINVAFNANIDLSRPNRLLPTPSFLDPKQTSPNRPKIPASALPRPPSNWMHKNPKKPMDFSPNIPESYVEENERLFRELHKLNISSKTNSNISVNKERNIQPKRLFDTRSDNLLNTTPPNPYVMNTSPNSKAMRYRNNVTRKVVNDEINNTSSSSQKRSHQNSNAFGVHSAFDHQFVPLQVARNNQSHRHPMSPKKLSPPKSELNVQQTTNVNAVTRGEHRSSQSSEEIEILTPESIIHFSSPSSASKDKPNDEIEILSPETIAASSGDRASSGGRRTRRHRLGVNLN